MSVLLSRYLCWMAESSRMSSGLIVVLTKALSLTSLLLGRRRHYLALNRIMYENVHPWLLSPEGFAEFLSRC